MTSMKQLPTSQLVRLPSIDEELTCKQVQSSKVSAFREGEESKTINVVLSVVRLTITQLDSAIQEQLSFFPEYTNHKTSHKVCIIPS
jgi:hypothetical protein